MAEQIEPFEFVTHKMPSTISEKGIGVVIAREIPKSETTEAILTVDFAEFKNFRYYERWLQKVDGVG